MVYDDIFVWAKIIFAFVALGFFICEYVEAIIASWRQHGTPSTAAGPSPQRADIRDHIATAVAGFIGAIVAGAFGISLAASPPGAPKAGINGAQGAVTARDAGSLANGTTVRALAEAQAVATVAVPEGRAIPAPIKDWIRFIYTIVYLLIGLACLVTWAKRKDHTLNKVKTLASIFASMMLASIAAL